MDGSANDILYFWFAEETRPKWFVTDAALDAVISRRFDGLFGRAAAGELDGWPETPRGALALVILLDQFPRNMFRQSPKAFATDAKALAVSGAAIARGFDTALTQEVEKHFLFMPFMHSEALADQDRCVALFEGMGADERTLGYARRHRDIIARFGRFPHRNRILGRVNTAEEDAFLKEPGSSF